MRSINPLLSVGILGLGVGACQTNTLHQAEIESLPRWELVVPPSRELIADNTVGRQFMRAFPARLPNGDLLVADAGSKELRMFRGDTLIARLGGQGEGPGELRDIHRLSIVHDTIVVLSLPMVSRDVNVFATEGGFISRFRLRAPVGAPTIVPLGQLATGEFLVEEGRGFTALKQEPPIGQLIPDSVSWGLLRQARGDSVGTYQPLGRFHRHFLVAYRTPDMPIPFSLTQFTLGPTTQWALSSDLVWIADGATGAFAAFDGQGQQVAAGRLPAATEPFTVAALRRARGAALDAAGNEARRKQVEAVFDPALRPAMVPVLDALSPGPDGEVWARRYRLDAHASQWFVVMNREGQPVAQVEVPAEVTVHQAGRDYVVGVRRDADGVESVVEYRLLRGS